MLSLFFFNITMRERTGIVEKKIQDLFPASSQT